MEHEKLDGRYSEALDIIQNVQDLMGCVQINHHQCKRLVGFYNRAGKFFQRLQQASRDFKDLSLPSLNVTIIVLQKGQILIEKYTKEGWLESMVTAGVNQDSFKAIHEELEACIRSIHEWAQKKVPGIMQVPFMKLANVTPLLFLVSDDRASLFRGDAEMDKSAMLKKIALESTKRITRQPRYPAIFTFWTSWTPVLRILGTIIFGGENLTEKQRSEIRSLNMASEKIIVEEQNSRGQGRTRTEELPSYLRIESSEIQMLESIGKGGSAEVFKCTWLHRDYAVKIFWARDGVIGLRKEVETFIRLRHPNVVLLIGFSVHQVSNCPMIVMELLHGDLKTLIQTDSLAMEETEETEETSKRPKKRKKRKSSRVRRQQGSTNQKSTPNPFPTSTAVDFIYQIATGMAYLHKQKIFHGDLKALNVLVRRHEGGYELKISDFGVSEQLVVKKDHVGYESDCTSFNTANVGTLRWRAPEVFNVRNAGQRSYSLKADVYSFAMTCVEILTRKYPYHDIPPHIIKEHVQAGKRPVLPIDVPDDLRKLIRRCWNHVPALRPDFSDICTELQGLKRHSHSSDIPTTSTAYSSNLSELESGLGAPLGHRATDGVEHGAREVRVAWSHWRMGLELVILLSILIAHHGLPGGYLPWEAWWW